MKAPIGELLDNEGAPQALIHPAPQMQGASDGSWSAMWRRA